MTVSELIAELQKHPLDSEVHFCTEHSGFGTTEVEEVYDGTATYGLLLVVPKTVNTVVLDTSTCGI